MLPTHHVDLLDRHEAVDPGGSIISTSILFNKIEDCKGSVFEYEGVGAELKAA